MEVARLESVFTADTRNFEAGTARVERRLDHVSGRFGTLGTAASRAGSILAGAFVAAVTSAGAGLAALAVGSVRSAASMDALERGLATVMRSAERAQGELVRLREVARLPGLGFREAIEGSTNLQAAGFNADMAARALMGFGNALATVGKGKAELQGINVALTQLANSPKVLQEEINQIRERLPQFQQLMMAAFGTARSEDIQKLGISGQQFVERMVVELEKLPRVTGGVQNALENFSDTIDQAFVRIGRPLLEPLSQAVDAISPLLERVSQRVAAAIPAIASELRSIWTGLPEATHAAFADMLSSVQQLGGQVVNWFRDNYPLIKATVVAVLNGIAHFWRQHGEDIKILLGGLLSVISSTTKFTMQAMTGDWIGAFRSLGQAVTKAIPVIGAAVRLLVDAALDQIRRNFSTGAQIGQQLGRAIAEGVGAGIRERAVAAVGGAMQMLIGIADHAARVKALMRSPSRLFMQIGEGIVQGIVAGLVGGIPSVERAMEALIAAAASRFSTRERVVGGRPIEDAGRAISEALERQAAALREMRGGETELEQVENLIARVLANPATAHLMDANTQALLRFNAAIRDNAQATRERLVGLPPEMRADPDATRARNVFGADPESVGVTRPRRVFEDQVALARQSMGEIADDLTSMFDSIFDGLKRGWKGLWESLARIATDTLQLIATEFVSSALMQILTGQKQQSKAGGIIGWLVNSVLGAFGGAAAGGLGGSTGGFGHEIGHGFGFQHGGMVPGFPGQPRLAMVHGGEMILNREQQRAVGNTTIINFNYTPRAADNYVQKKSQREIWDGITGYARMRAS